MASADRKAKDQAMASMMRDRGIPQGRTVQVCPICYKNVSNAAFGNHIAVHR